MMPSVHVFTSVVYSYMGEPYASLLSGMVLGVDVPKSLAIYDYFKQTGLLHLVVLSGANINFLVATVMRLTSHMGKGIAAIISLCTITVFVLFVGPEPPVVRAGLMSACTLLALIFHRQSLALITLLTTGAIVGIVKFEWLTTVSFQLSFGASLGIILWSPHIVKKQKKGIWAIGQYVRDDMRTTLAAQVVTTPLIMFYFREISLIAPIANLMVSFVTGPIMILGIVTMILGKLSYVLGYVPAKFVLICLIYVCEVTRYLSSLPFVFLRF